jgi:hypothetical protein
MQSSDQSGCSFWGRDQTQVKQVVAGHGGAGICEECIALCFELMEENGIVEAQRRLVEFAPERIMRGWSRCTITASGSVASTVPTATSAGTPVFSRPPASRVAASADRRTGPVRRSAPPGEQACPDVDRCHHDLEHRCPQRRGRRGDDERDLDGTERQRLGADGRLAPHPCLSLIHRRTSGMYCISLSLVSSLSKKQASKRL